MNALKGEKKPANAAINTMSCTCIGVNTLYGGSSMVTMGLGSSLSSYSAAALSSPGLVGVSRTLIFTTGEGAEFGMFDRGTWMKTLFGNSSSFEAGGSA